MADYPAIGNRALPVLSSYVQVAMTLRAVQGAGNIGSTTWPSANRAIFVPFYLSAPYLLKSLWWANGSAAAAGNVDVGVYTLGDAAGATAALITSTGAVAQGVGTSIPQTNTLATAVLLQPGPYYMAISASSASASFFGVATTVRQCQLMGIAQMAAAQPLPATATLATPASAYFPLFGIASITTY